MTLFEKIIARQIPAQIVYETEEVLAFRDIAPQAPVHVLVIPKKPIPRLSATTSEDAVLLGRLMVAIREIAAQEGLDEGGYRVVTNNGENGGQTVDHLHFHVLGGRRLSWPPG